DRASTFRVVSEEDGRALEVRDREVEIAVPVEVRRDRSPTHEAPGEVLARVRRHVDEASLAVVRDEEVGLSITLLVGGIRIGELARAHGAVREKDIEIAVVVEVDEVGAEARGSRGRRGE